jgi:hypothetical protein
MSQKYADAEKCRQRRDNLGHGFAAWLKMPGRAARRKWL